MHFTDFSALLLLASTVAAYNPRHHRESKWEHYHYHDPSFPSLKATSAGFPMSAGTGTAVVPHGTGLSAASMALESVVPSVPSALSGGDGIDKEKPQENPGLPFSSAPAKAVSSPSVAAAPKPAPTSSAPSSSGGGVSYTATFTEYGLNDGNGSPNCNAATVSCGFYNTPGYNAAVSQNLFGAASGKTGTCGTCWQLDPVSNPNAEDTTAVVPGLNSIVVMVNNLCPASSNEKDCGQQTLSDTNFAGANVNFDLCKDDGAANALFGSSGIGMAYGKATEVSCDLWTGSQNYTTGTMPSMPYETS